MRGRGLGRLSRQRIRLCQSHSLRQQVPVLISTVRLCQYSSSAVNSSPPGAAGININAIRAKLLARPSQVHRDALSTTNSLCLHTALSQFLPEPLHRVPDKELAPGHHFVYFPLNRSALNLCPDGSDPYHSPHTHFTRRMWAGGSIGGLSRLNLNGRVAFCLERIVDVDVRGSTGAEKIFVTVLREYTTLPNFEDAFRLVKIRGVRSLSGLIHHLTHNVRSTDLPKYDLKGITEERTLVFMREPSDEEKKVSLEQEQRIVKGRSS